MSNHSAQHRLNFSNGYLARLHHWRVMTALNTADRADGLPTKGHLKKIRSRAAYVPGKGPGAPSCTQRKVRFRDGTTYWIFSDGSFRHSQG